MKKLSRSFVVIFLSLLPLSLAALACNLGNNPSSPTPPPPPTVPTLSLPSATPSPTETLSPTPTDQSDGSSGVIAGCSPRTDWPIYTVRAGDTLSSIARRSNSTSDALQTANCLSSANVIYVGAQLRVPVVPASGSTALPGCTTPWFFTFAANVAESSICPGPLYSTPAAGEDFEGGRAYYYATINGVVGPSVYIIYNDGTWERYDDRYNGSTEAPSDPSIVPPASRYQPVRAIGKVWRENSTVRTRLGWAYAPERDFAGRRQSPIGSGIFFIDHGVRNVVLRLDNTNNRWSVAGTY